MRHSKIFMLVLAAALALPMAAFAEGNYGFDKGFFVKSDDGNFSNTTYGYVTSSLEDIVYDPDADNSNTFALDEFRIGWFGNVFSKNIEYLMEYDFANGAVTDGYMNFVYDETLNLRVGRFKIPYNFETLVKDHSLNMFARSFANSKFSYGRGVGAMINGVVMDDMIEYYVGAFNSNGANTNARSEFLYAFRVMANLMGTVDYTMGDLKNSETPNVAFGLGFVYDTVDPSGTDDVYEIRLSPDINVRYMGFSLLGEFHYDKIKDIDARYGITTIAGYFLIPEMVEVTARYSGYYDTADGAAATDDEWEVGGGINYYLYGHQVKAIANYVFHKNSGTSAKTHTITFGAQVGFF